MSLIIIPNILTVQKSYICILFRTLQLQTNFQFRFQNNLSPHILIPPIIYSLFLLTVHFFNLFRFSFAFFYHFQNQILIPIIYSPIFLAIFPSVYLKSSIHPISSSKAMPFFLKIFPNIIIIIRQDFSPSSSKSLYVFEDLGIWLIMGKQFLRLQKKIKWHFTDFQIFQIVAQNFRLIKMKNTVLLLIIVAIGLVSAQIRTPTLQEYRIGRPILDSQIRLEKILAQIQENTIDGYQYQGETSITIINGVSDRMSYYITLYPWKNNCQYDKCYYGYVNNYTVKNEENNQNQVIQGYSDTKLEARPIFRFGTNSREDYQIKYHHQILPIFKEIIQISCEKFNPVFEPKVKATASTLAIPTGSSRNLLASPSSDERKYKFQKIGADKLEYLVYGQNIATKIQNAQLKNTKFNQSFTKQEIVQRDDGLVGLDKEIYDFDLGNSGAQLLQFKGKIQIDLIFKRVIHLPFSFALKILQEVESNSNGKPAVELTAEKLNTNRGNGIVSELTEVKPTYDSSYKPGSHDPVTFPGERSSGVKVVEEFEKAKNKDPVSSGVNVVSEFRNAKGSPLTIVDEKLISDLSKIQIATRQDAFTNINKRSLGNVLGRRNLMVVSVQHIYDYKKTLYQKTIIGREFKVQLRVDCDYIILTDDHQIGCRGWADFKFFNSQKSLELFDFKKSVSLIWEFNKSLDGQWETSVWVGLPQPKILGFNFQIKMKYYITINLSSKVPTYTPYTVEVKAIVNAQTTTDSSAAIRVLAVEGGVYIKGTLVKVKSDPMVTAVFDFPQQKVTLKSLWFAELSTFEAEWGFFSRRWRIRKGWTQKNILSKWPINSRWRRWKLHESTLVVNVE